MQPNPSSYCTVCGKSPTDRAHIRTRGAGAGWEWNEHIPLCRYHHQEQHTRGWLGFCSKYPKVVIELDARGWEFVKVFGISKLREKEK